MNHFEMLYSQFPEFAIAKKSRIHKLSNDQCHATGLFFPFWTSCVSGIRIGTLGERLITHKLLSVSFQTHLEHQMFVYSRESLWFLIAHSSHSSLLPSLSNTVSTLLIYSFCFIDFGRGKKYLKRKIIYPIQSYKWER